MLLSGSRFSVRIGLAVAPHTGIHFIGQDAIDGDRVPDARSAFPSKPHPFARRLNPHLAQLATNRKVNHRLAVAIPGYVPGVHLPDNARLPLVDDKLIAFGAELIPVRRLAHTHHFPVSGFAVLPPRGSLDNVAPFFARFSSIQHGDEQIGK